MPGLYYLGSYLLPVTDDRSPNTNRFKLKKNKKAKKLLQLKDQVELWPHRIQVQTAWISTQLSISQPCDHSSAVCLGSPVMSTRWYHLNLASKSQSQQLTVPMESCTLSGPIPEDLLSKARGTSHPQKLQACTGEGVRTSGYPWENWDFCHKNWESHWTVDNPWEGTNSSIFMGQRAS